ncbi:CPBP family intramembrane glutamic endopeptidase [Clostridium rectalis]|uniref:CPBP family intramembrane glutamic endopeptidase n=1 Tax=Clostridium rectalis TaxID=2040295 RepID=UPI000F6430BE|nr:CPBP family intramembrane glutamic endopeptidase [Clostridium rectalis]
MHVSGSLINEFISTVVNIVAFTVIPLIFYLAKEKTFIGFIHSLGIYKVEKINFLKVVFIITLVYLITLAANLIIILTGNSGRNSVDMLEYKPLVLFLYLLLYGIKTGVAEEIFFRGFIAKKFINKLGFFKGNILQAIAFASPHFVIRGTASKVDIIFRIINAFLLGYVFGYITYKKCQGSIIPCIISHIFINMLSSFILLIVI